MQGRHLVFPVFGRPAIHEQCVSRKPEMTNHTFSLLSRLAPSAEIAVAKAVFLTKDICISGDYA
jgi:hypothetical protein